MKRIISCVIAGLFIIFLMGYFAVRSYFNTVIPDLGQFVATSTQRMVAIVPQHREEIERARKEILRKNSENKKAQNEEIGNEEK
jgi:hypothetical protein